jgi:ketosteroid isomerase-like protein
MGADDEAATKALYEFYDALDDLLQAKGTRRMSDIWHHGDYVTAAHPFGGWARGWAEVWATWEEAAAVFAVYKGHAARNEPIGGIHEFNLAVRGDVAYCTSIYKSTLYMSDTVLRLKANCTDIAHRVDGVWKLVHHHADQAPPDWQAAIGRMVQTGRS